MIINHNISALNTHRQLSTNTANTNKNIEKLSSGLRINRAGDDAAGLAISEKMRGQIRGLDQATRNAQDGISMIQTAEGALNETHSILQRMRELSVQSSNDTNTTGDREELQKEMNQLTSEINRIGNTTEFNTKKLLNGDLSDTKSLGSKVVAAAGDKTVSYASGATWSGDTAGKFSITSDGTAAGIKFSTTGATGGFNFDTLKHTANNKLTIEKDANGFKVDFAGEDAAGDKMTINAEQMVLNGDNYTYDNHGVTFQIAKSEFDKVAVGTKVELNLVSGATATVDATAANKKVVNDWTSVGHATDATKQVSLAGDKITVQNSDKRLENATQIKIVGTGDMNAASGKISVQFLDKDNNVLDTDDFQRDGTTAKFQGQAFAYNANGVNFTLNVGSAMTAEGFSLTQSLGSENKSLGTTNGNASFQIGANENQSMTLSVSDMRASALGLTGAGNNFSTTANVTNGTNNTNIEKALDVTSSKSAANAITVIDSAIKNVSSERSKLGAVQNRLEHTINNLGTSSENLTAAESRIRDVDMAKEMMSQTKNNILAQAAQAMLAQANQQPQGVLQLLR